MVYPVLLPLMRTPRLPVVYWNDAPADLNGLVPFAERRNLVSAHVPSHFYWPLPHKQLSCYQISKQNSERGQLFLTPYLFHGAVILEKLTVKKFPAFYGTRRFITAFTFGATCPFPEPARSSPYPHIPLLALLRGSYCATDKWYRRFG